MRIIRRYANGKLYDALRSRHLKLPEVAALVRLGEDLRIIEHRTERDVTAIVFAQILYEEEKEGPRLSVAELARIIREGFRED